MMTASTAEPLTLSAGRAPDVAIAVPVAEARDVWRFPGVSASIHTTPGEPEPWSGKTLRIGKSFFLSRRMDTTMVGRKGLMGDGCH